MSSLTFALLQDTGWYQVSSAYETLMWGYQQGCNFVNSKCISAGVASNSQYFCTSASVKSCDYLRSGYGPCGVGTYTQAIDTAFQYFANPAQGGTDQLADFCPSTVVYNNRVCGNPASQLSAAQNAAGEVFGGSSKCFESTLLSPRFSSSGLVTGCYQYNCVCTAGVTSIDITVCSDVGSNACSTQRCTTAGAALSFTGYSGSITCPPINQICLYNSDYANGVGACTPPQPSGEVIISLTGGAVPTTASTTTTFSNTQGKRGCLRNEPL
jgi:hypothetical protein